MRRLRAIIVAASLLLTIALWTSDARAYGGGYYPGWYPYWVGAPHYVTTTIPAPPYFAVHPPVYYGQRVTMPYGDSPFARLPEAVVRPRCEAAARPEPEVAPEGQWIENPFYQPGGAAGERPAAPEQLPPPDTTGIIENPYFTSGQR
jgi:hypothetical protein